MDGWFLMRFLMFSRSVKSGCLTNTLLLLTVFGIYWGLLVQPRWSFVDLTKEFSNYIYIYIVLRVFCSVTDSNFPWIMKHPMLYIYPCFVKPSLDKGYNFVISLRIQDSGVLFWGEHIQKYIPVGCRIVFAKLSTPK